MSLPSHLEVNEKGHLAIAGHDTVTLVQQYGTPLYIYDEDYIRKRMREYVAAFNFEDSMVAYAGKAFLTKAMCRIIEDEGLYLDVVSGGELYTAMVSEFPPERIIVHGNNKSETELFMALKAGVGLIVVDNYTELQQLIQLGYGIHAKKIDVLLRIVPGVEAHTHDYIQTGQIDTKFGFDIESGMAMEALEKAIKSKIINVVGVHFHIGSQLLNLEPFKLALENTARFLAKAKERFNWEAEIMDVGGGLGIRHIPQENPPSISILAKTIKEGIDISFGKYNLQTPKVIVEPGRSIVGESAIAIYSVGLIKDIPGVRTYVAVDGGMADNLRPALYQAKYDAVLCKQPLAKREKVVTLVGKNCETGDILIEDIAMPKIQRGDLVAMLSAGAYTYSMASNYNKLPKPAILLASSRGVFPMVNRETYEDIIRKEVMPEHLEKNNVRA